MARIIEYDEGDYGGRGGYGGGAALIVIVILILLYTSGYLPWFTSASTAVAPRPLVTTPVVTPTLAGSIGYVIAERLNMRTAPGGYSVVTYILPRGTRVIFTGETYREPNGELWIQVRIDTYEGVQVGWVNRQYVS